MNKSKNNKIEDCGFNQKKINHIFHYLNNFEILLKILNEGFAPSYCLENFNNKEYFIPMISFCNIPLRDVDLFMRYGKYGIGMSIEWALDNSISPVIYLHNKTPFSNDNNNQNILSFFKNWKTTYKNKEIITYQEREWRYVPKLPKEKILITQIDEEFKLLKNKKYREKPHLPEYTINIKNIKDLRYIIIKNKVQRDRVIKLLNNKFGNKEVLNSIISGKLLIINDDLIKNDF